MERLGWIHLRGLHVDGVRVGVYPHEERSAQSVVVDASLASPIGAAADQERIDATIDYDAVARRLRELCRARYYPLLESLCEKLAAALLAEFGPERVRVEVAKPGALAPGTVSVAVERERQR